MDDPVVVVSFLFLTLAVGGTAQTVTCFVEQRNCGGSPFTFGLTQCRDLVNGLSYTDLTSGQCVNFPIRFGFEQTSIVGVEREDEYSVNVGFLQGAIDATLVVSVNIILETPTRNSDLNLITPTRTFPARTFDTQPVTFTLALDSIAQEFNETFKLRLSYDRSLFESNATVTFFDEISVTILDRDEANLGFSEEDYVASEAQDLAAPVRILKDTNARLANPVVLRVTPLVVDDALAQGVINIFSAEVGLTPQAIQRSPLRANGADFNTAAFAVAFPADEDEDSPIIAVNVPIPIINDNIDEADEQRFIVTLDVIDAVNPVTLNIERDVATCIIQDDDIARIGFSQQVYTYFEPPFPMMFSNVTLVKDDNQVSEQTFGVSIVASDAPGITPATLQTADTAYWDYRIGAVGQTVIQRDFLPHLQQLPVTLFMNGDNLPEGLEGFLLTFSVVTEGFPVFSPPLSDSTTAFPSTRIEITDDDFTRVGWEELSYFVSETATVGQACIIVYNPPTDVALRFDIQLEYQSVDGTADGSDFIEIATTPLTISASTSSTNSRRTCVQYFVFADGISEVAESFTLTLNFVQQFVVIEPSVTQIFIVDSDAQLPTTELLPTSATPHQPPITQPPTSQLTPTQPPTTLTAQPPTILPHTTAVTVSAPSPPHTPVTVMATTLLQVETSLFQLRLFGVENCESWKADNPTAKDSDILHTLISKIVPRCNCAFTEDRITEQEFQCFSSFPDAVTYRAVLHGTREASVQDLLHHIEQWIQEGDSVSVQFQLLTVDRSYDVAISSFFDTECRAGTGTGTGEEPVSTSILVGAVLGVSIAVILVTSALAVLIVVWKIKASRAKPRVPGGRVQLGTLSPLYGDINTYEVVLPPAQASQQPLPPAYTLAAAGHASGAESGQYEDVHMTAVSHTPAIYLAAGEEQQYEVVL